MSSTNYRGHVESQVKNVGAQAVRLTGWRMYEGGMLETAGPTQEPAIKSSSLCYIGQVQLDRRTFFEYLGAAALTPVLVHSQEASGMWGMIAKITLVPGKREEMIEILKQSAAHMPGCLSYVVAKDAADENSLWGQVLGAGCQALDIRCWV